MSAFLGTIMEDVPNAARALLVFIYFCLCAFLGWIIELLFRSAVERRFVNPGFLYGPVVPIYGFAAVFVYFIDIYTQTLSTPLRLALFFILPTILEYSTSFFLEKIMSLKLWDYSACRLNIHGRVCLKYSIAWFALVLVHTRFTQPFFFSWIEKIPDGAARLLAMVLFVYLSIDTALSIKLYRLFMQLRARLGELLKLENRISGDSIFKGAPLLAKLRAIIKPINVFPHLMVYMQHGLVALIERIAATTTENPDALPAYSNDADFNRIARSIVEHPEYQKLQHTHHHGNSVYVHSLHVAWISYTIGTYLSKHINVHIVDLTRGALLHDFFLYDWRKERPASGKLHAFEHPKEAFLNAKKNFQPISAIEKDIITKHMWPLTVIPPRYLETIIVNVVDKLVATKEILNENNDARA